MLNVFRMNKRASIPVTIFVIVVLVLLMVTLGSFALKSFFDKGVITEGFEKVQEYNLKIQEAGFTGTEFNEGIRKYEKDYWIFGKETLRVSVSRIP